MYFHHLIGLNLLILISHCLANITSCSKKCLCGKNLPKSLKSEARCLGHNCICPEEDGYVSVQSINSVSCEFRESKLSKNGILELSYPNSTEVEILKTNGWTKAKSVSSNFLLYFKIDRNEDLTITQDFNFLDSIAACKSLDKNANLAQAIDKIEWNSLKNMISPNVGDHVYLGALNTNYNNAVNKSDYHWIHNDAHPSHQNFIKNHFGITQGEDNNENCVAYKRNVDDLQDKKCKNFKVKLVLCEIRSKSINLVKQRRVVDPQEWTYTMKKADGTKLYYKTLVNPVTLQDDFKSNVFLSLKMCRDMHPFAKLVQILDLEELGLIKSFLDQQEHDYSVITSGYYFDWLSGGGQISYDLGLDNVVDDKKCIMADRDGLKRFDCDELNYVLCEIRI